MRAVRPIIEKTIQEWAGCSLINLQDKEKGSEGLQFQWSPLFETVPSGGPKNQPQYINAVLVVKGPQLEAMNPNEQAAVSLLYKFLTIEKNHGRVRSPLSERWGPRSLDIDLLSWGELQIQNEALTLPHPRMNERSFVLIPLAAAVLAQSSHPPRKLPAHQDWPE